MDGFLYFMDLCWQLVGMEFNLWGYEFSHLSIIVVELVFGLVCYVLHRFF